MKFEATELPYNLPQFLSKRPVRVLLLTDLYIVSGHFRRGPNYCPKFVINLVVCVSHSNVLPKFH